MEPKKLFKTPVECDPFTQDDLDYLCSGFARELAKELLPLKDLLSIDDSMIATDPNIFIVPFEESSRLFECLDLLTGQIGEMPSPELLSSAEPAAERFDVNRFLEVFDNVKLRDGCTLDYVYHNDASWGAPFVYTRKKSDKPLGSLKEYMERYDKDKKGQNCFEHIYFEKTPLGYFQFAQFTISVHLFYRYWHAYSSQNIIFRPERLKEILIEYEKKGGHIDSGLSAIALMPRVQMTGSDTATVSHVVQLENGFFFRNSRIQWPNAQKGYDIKAIMEYEPLIIW
jgi:hypothetical protein